MLPSRSEIGDSVIFQELNDDSGNPAEVGTQMSALYSAPVPGIASDPENLIGKLAGLVRCYSGSLATRGESLRVTP